MDLTTATGNPCLSQVTVESTHIAAVTISFVSPIIMAARGVGGVFCVFLGHFSHSLHFRGGFDIKRLIVNSCKGAPS